jgi:2-polyprenyl-6-methoxyphenol hydroxylase-like FAD-dependent oxidoreductase
MLDAIIVGGRAAGASLGMLLARRGRKVLIVDRATFPSDTLSTHFFWPRTTAFLKTWGLLDRLAASGCPPITRVRWTMGDFEFVGAPSEVRGVATMYCPRRTVLDAMLVEGAREAGAEVREGVNVRDVLWSDGRVAGVVAQDAEGERLELRARIVVGADGMNSRIARGVAASYKVYEEPITFAFYAYWNDVALDHFGGHRSAGSRVLEFPTHNRQTCIYVGWPMARYPELKASIERAYLDEIAGAWGVRDRARKGQCATQVIGSSKLPNFYRRSAGPGWALVGDAAYHKDPTTGMGIADAFLGAELLAEAIDAGLRHDASCLDQSTLAYDRQLYDQTRFIFDWTLACSQFREQALMLDFFRGVLTSEADTIRMFDIYAGKEPMRTLFNEEAVKRYSAIGRARSDARVA